MPIVPVLISFRFIMQLGVFVEAIQMRRVIFCGSQDPRVGPYSYGKPDYASYQGLKRIPVACGPLPLCRVGRSLNHGFKVGAIWHLQAFLFTQNMHTDTRNGSRSKSVGTKSIFQSRTRQGSQPEKKVGATPGPVFFQRV